MKSMNVKQTKHNAIKNLICHIKVMYYNNDPMLSNVEDVNLLYNALCDLDEIVGMYEVKDSIVKQIKFLLVNHSSNDKGKFDGHMLHTVIYGPPGVGKTTIGTCLANIWKGLGLIKKKKNSENKSSSSGNRNIRILPIFLIKEKESRNEEKGDTLKNELKFEDDNKQLENSIKSYLNGDNDDIILPEKEKYNSETKYNKKKKVEKQNDSKFTTKIKELDDGIFSTNKYDDMKSNIKNYSESAKKIRNAFLLEHAGKNMIRTTDNSNAKQQLKRAKTNTDNIMICNRNSFVGQYVGHTCDKTQKLLTNALEQGKILFVDEAYSLVLDEKDSFGHEALNELNRFMSENPELIVIFAGYRAQLENTLFKYQPGFKRRCTWMFEIIDYTGEMLTAIFKGQLLKEGWKYEGKDEDLNNFFEKKIKNFDAFGGDTVRLCLYCKLKYAEAKFEFSTSDKLKDKTITLDIVKIAYDEIYCKNKPEPDTRIETWRTMYN